MNKKFTLIISLVMLVILSFSFDERINPNRYKDNYLGKLDELKAAQKELLATIEQSDIQSEYGKSQILSKVELGRNMLKGLDFWLRYMEPIAYRRINGPLPVEWETEVFEKFEAPYKREGTGLTQIALYMEEDGATKEHMLYLAQSSLDALETFYADSITTEFKRHDHFYLCNRLFLLNLAAIYTTGFECPDTSRIIPELRIMLNSVHTIYNTFNESYSKNPLPQDYLDLYSKMVVFVNQQPSAYSSFDHFTFIRDYVNPLFMKNQQLLNTYKVFSRSMVDYSLNKKVISLFDKDIYRGQEPKGIFHRVEDETTIAEIERVGKLLFYDPILSVNNERSCASCHKPTEYFTDTVATTALQLNRKDVLPRNTPSLINAQYNHLVMADGKHIDFLKQAHDVITNPIEMGCAESDIVSKVMSCNDYNKTFKKLLQHTPTEKEVTFEHIASTLTFYYSKFNKHYSPFDEAMNSGKPLAVEMKQGFNLFMSKSQCATCHFVPQFNGVKPPFVGSEFEVLGVPEDTAYTALSNDIGRYSVHKADEMKNAFRTGSIRNIQYTKPYMHNGVFNTLDEVVDFYNAGGGAGRGLDVPNQTLSADSLALSRTEKDNLVKFMLSLNEQIPFEAPPEKLPASRIKEYNTRKVGGTY